MSEHAISQPRDLPIGPTGRVGVGIWGMWTLIATEAALFSYLLFSYFYLGAQGLSGWLLEPHPSLKYALPSTLVSLVSAASMALGVRAVRREQRSAAVLGFLIACVLGLVFAWLQLADWRAKPFHLGTSSYSSVYFVTSGFDLAHELAGVLMLALLALWTALGYFTARRSTVVTVTALYWYFVTVIWLAVFATFYVSPYLGFGQWH